MNYIYTDENYANNDSTEYIENYTGKVIYKVISDVSTTIYYFECINSTFRIDLNGKIYWESGTWESGTWYNGIWNDGTWNSGTWYNGTWNAGTWNNGIIYKIIWYDGIFNNGLFGAYNFIEEKTTQIQTEWIYGNFINGIFNGDIWRNGIWYNNAIWLSGNWIQGYNENGIFTGNTPISTLYNNKTITGFSGYIKYLYFKDNSYSLKNFECENIDLNIENDGYVNIENGIIKNGIIENGIINNCVIRNIEIMNGYISNTTIYESIINSGNFESSNINGSTWNNGSLINSNIFTSYWYDGSFTNSNFRTSSWYGGTFNSGNWYTNESYWYDGDWILGNIDDIESSIAPYISGNNHYFTNFSGKLLYVYNNQSYIIQCKDATLQISEIGIIQWEIGTFTDSTWNNGTWNDGIFTNSTWNNGIWNGGTFTNSTWNNGTWNSGTWNSGTWYNGIWNDGIWYNGIWNDGTWNSGTWYNGTWNNGNWITLYSLWFDGNWNGGIQNGELIDGNLTSSFNSNILKSINFKNEDLDSSYKIKYTLTDLGITKSTDIILLDNEKNIVTNNIQHAWNNGILTIQFIGEINGIWELQYYINIENVMLNKDFSATNLNENNQIVFSLNELNIDSETEIIILDNNNNFVPTINTESYVGNDYNVTYYWNNNNLILQFYNTFYGNWEIQYYKESNNQSGPRLNIIDENTKFYDENNNLYNFTGEFRFIIEKEDGTIKYYPIKVKNAQFILEKDGFIKWYNGEFLDGIWYDGIWNVNSLQLLSVDENFEINIDLDIIFETNDDSILCKWVDGTWISGNWFYNNSIWESGTWTNGKINNIESSVPPTFVLGNGKSFENYSGNITYYFENIFYSFSCENSTFSLDETGNFEFESGIWNSGTWNAGDWYGEQWNNGTWNNGTWHCGIWKLGTWNGGTWELNDRYYFESGVVTTKTEQGTYIKIGERYSTIPPLFGFFDDSYINENNSSTSSISSSSEESSSSSGEIVYDVKIWKESLWEDGFIGEIKSTYPPIYDEANGKSFNGLTDTIVYKVKIYDESTEQEFKYWEYFKLICVSAIVTFSEDGYITWNYGTISGGIWYNGIFKNGEFSGDIWYNGIWNSGTWYNGTWNNGTWNNGNWLTNNSIWNNGDWVKGYIDGIYSEMSPIITIGNNNSFINYTGYINYKVLINETTNIFKYYWILVSNSYLDFNSDGYITWHRGTLSNGTWYNGIWKNQYLEQNEWKDTNSITSIWNNGLFINGTWENGNWINGEWYVDNNENYFGIWEKGYINGILSSDPPIFDFINENSIKKTFTNYTGRLKYKYQNLNNYNEINTDYNIINCKNADFEIKYNSITKIINNQKNIYYEPFIYWHNGTWDDGTWYNGIWNDGTWNNGTWRIGSWINGTWNDGIFYSGMWYNGIWKNGTYHDRRKLNIFEKNA